MDIRRVEGLGISFCFRVSIRVSIGGDGNRGERSWRCGRLATVPKEMIRRRRVLSHSRKPP